MTLNLIFLALAGYLLGSIASAVVICRIFKKNDPRRFGSKNPGATNVMRIAGKRYAILVLAFDTLKGILPVYIARSLAYPQSIQASIGLIAVLGHMFPIFFKFRGGKGVATGIGALMILSPLSALSCIALFLGIAFIFRIVSLSSIASAAATPFIYYAINGYLDLSVCLLAVLIIIKHHSNIKKILQDTENKLN